MVAIGRIVTRFHQSGSMSFIVDSFELIKKRYSLLAIGIKYHDTFISTTKHVDIAKKFYLAIVD